jgi:hypothetical protein
VIAVGAASEANLAEMPPIGTKPSRSCLADMLRVTGDGGEAAGSGVSHQL